MRNWKVVLALVAALILNSARIARAQDWEPIVTNAADYTFYGVWGSTDSNVFVVGGRVSALPSDTVLWHFDGSTLSPELDSGEVYFLNQTWGSSSSDVYAVGAVGTILHYDGSTWSPMVSGTSSELFGIWGSSSSDVYAVGYDYDLLDSTILHYNGSMWSQIPSGTTSILYGIWGSSSSDVFVVGEAGTILHYNGSQWSATTSGTTDLYGIWGSSSNDVYAVGAGGKILHFDGSTWSPMNSGTSSELYGIWGSSPGNVYAVGYDDVSPYNGTILHYDGSTWSPMDSGTSYPLWGVWGTSSGDVFAVGDFGTMLRHSENALPAWRSGEADLGDGWKWTEWFGSYNTTYYPWVYHAQHGWLYPYDDGAGGVFFWYNDIQKFVWTTPANYPLLYRWGGGDTWLWYQKDTSNPRLFYNYSTEQWEAL